MQAREEPWQWPYPYLPPLWGVALAKQYVREVEPLAAPQAAAGAAMNAAEWAHRIGSEGVAILSAEQTRELAALLRRAARVEEAAERLCLIDDGEGCFGPDLDEMRAALKGKE